MDENELDRLAAAQGFDVEAEREEAEFNSRAMIGYELSVALNEAGASTAEKQDALAFLTVAILACETFDPDRYQRALDFCSRHMEAATASVAEMEASDAGE